MTHHNPSFIGVNATGDAGDASPAIFGEPGTKCLISPPKSLSKLLPTVRLRRLSFTELKPCCGQNTKRGSAEAERDYSELQQKQLNSVIVAVCHCHQDLLDAVNVNIGLY